MLNIFDRLRRRKFKFNLDQVGESVISGWVVGKKESPVIVEVRGGGGCYLSCKADLYRKDLKGPVSNDGCCAFRMEIDIEAQRAIKNHGAGLFFDGYQVCNDILSLITREKEKKHLIGSVDVASDKEVSGWATYRFATGANPVRVELVSDDGVLAECFAKDFREDLEDEGYAAGFCAYFFNVRKEWFKSQELHLNVLFDGVKFGDTLVLKYESEAASGKNDAASVDRSFFEQKESFIKKMLDDVRVYDDHESVDDVVKLINVLVHHVAELKVRVRELESFDRDDRS